MIFLFTGEMQYNDRLEDIRLLKIEVKNLRVKKNLLTRSLCNTVDMRQEVLQLTRDLTQERVKAKALEEEMSTPINIHRWRKLSGKDPAKMDLIAKVQTLQKFVFMFFSIFRYFSEVYRVFDLICRQVLSQTANALKKENALRQTNKVCNILKSTIKDYADAETIKQELCYTRRALTAKVRKVKALSAETNIKDRELKEKDSNLQQLRRDLCDKKEVLLREKRDKQKLKNQLLVIRNQIANEGLERPMSNPNFSYKTAGAGFRFHTASTIE